MSQIQKKNKLTPNTLFSKWAAILDQLVLMDKKSNKYFDQIQEIQQKERQHNLDIRDTKMCIVAESYKFTNDYLNNCNICSGCSGGGVHELGLPSFHQFYNSIRDGEIKEDWRETELVRYFINHIQENHKDLI